LNAIAIEDIRALLARVTRERSPSTSRRLLAVLGKMFADAVKSDYVRQNPVDRLDRRDKPLDEFLEAGHGQRRLLGRSNDKPGHALFLHFMHYNFCWVHQTHKMTPGTMIAGLTDHPWTVEEIVALLPN
jgi:hypothetical protein